MISYEKSQVMKRIIIHIKNVFLKSRKISQVLAKKRSLRESNKESYLTLTVNREWNWALISWECFGFVLLEFLALTKGGSIPTLLVLPVVGQKGKEK